MENEIQWRHRPIQGMERAYFTADSNGPAATIEGYSTVIWNSYMEQLYGKSSSLLTNL